MRGGKKASLQWVENLSFDQQAMVEAAQATFQAGATIFKFRGRTDIAQAGFSTKWQNTLRVDFYPNDGFNPGLRLWHKIPYAGVFEDGEHVKGQPLLWLPVPGLAKRFGKGQRLDPLSFERATGQDLIPFRDPNTGTPVLGVRIKVPRRGKTPKLSLSRLRRGTSGKTGVLATVPVFVGVKSVDIRKKFNMQRVRDSVAEELPGLYVRNME